MLSIGSQNFAVKSIFATTKAIYVIKNELHFLRQLVKNIVEQTISKNNSDVAKIIQAYEIEIAKYQEEIQLSWQKNKSMESEVLELKQMMDQLLKGYENDIKAKNSQIETLKNQLKNTGYNYKPELEETQPIVQSQLQQTGIYLKLPLSIIQQMPQSNTSTIRNEQCENQTAQKKEKISNNQMERSNCSYLRSQSTNISQNQYQKQVQNKFSKKNHNRIYSGEFMSSQNDKIEHFYSINQTQTQNQQKKSISQLLDEEENKENRQQNQNQLYSFMKPLSMNMAVSKNHVRSCSSGSLHFQSISGEEQSVLGQTESTQKNLKDLMPNYKPRSPDEEKSISICTQYEQQSYIKEEQNCEQDVKKQEYHQIIAYAKQNHTKNKLSRQRNIFFVHSQLNQSQIKDVREDQQYQNQPSLRSQLQKIIVGAKSNKFSQIPKIVQSTENCLKQKTNIYHSRNNYFIQNTTKCQTNQEEKRKYRSQQKNKPNEQNKNDRPRYQSSDKIIKEKKTENNIQKRKKIQTTNIAKISQNTKNYSAVSLFNAGSRKNKELLKRIRQGLSQYKLWKMPKNQQFTYEGNKIHGKRHGKGKIVYENGTVFEGQFVNGLKHGPAKITKDGILVFSGTFKEDLIQGQCIIKSLKLFADKQCNIDDICQQLHRAAYVGGFSKHKMHGQGTIILNTQGDKIWTKISNGVPYGQLTFFQHQQVFFSVWP